MNSNARNRYILVATIGYAFFALAWIFLSDQLLSPFDNIRSILWLSTAKGVFFVVLTATLLYFVLGSVPPVESGSHASLLEALASGGRPLKRSRWVAYLLALVLTATMVVVRQLIATSFADRPLLILFMLPIIFSALLGGVGPGLLSTALAAIGVDYLAIPPTHSFRIAASHDLVQWLFLIGNGAAVSLLSEMLHRAQIRAEASRRMLDSIVSGTTDAVFIKDTLGRYLLVNEAASRFVKKSKAEIIGHDDHRLFPENTAAEIMANDRAVMSGAQVVALEEHIVTLDGGEIVFLATKGPILDERDRVMGVFGICREITERKLAEDKLHELNAELERRVVERTLELRTANAELEELAYALTHNLCSPLRAMDGFSHLLLNEDVEHLPLEARGCLVQIREAATIMGQQLEGILMLLRCARVELHPERVDITALGRQLLGRLAKAEPERRVRCEVEEGIVADGDRGMLELVLTHLLNNAWKFTRSREDAVIRVISDKVDGRSAIGVADNGVGFDMAHAGRLFHPFQRLHRQDEFPGIGMGLASVQRIVHRHGGTVNAEGVPDQGAVFRFTLGNLGVNSS